jgi:tetratricopeptide (TPR) repeat protein
LYYARLLRDYEAGLKGAQFADVQKLIEIDLENALLSWNWLIVHDRRSYLASMMDTLGLFLEMEGYLAIGRRNFRSLVSRWQSHLAEEFTDFEKSEVERNATEPAQKSTSIHVTPRRVLDEAVRDLYFLTKALAWQSAFELDQHEAELLLFQSLSLLEHNRLDGGLGNAEKAFVFYRLGMTFGDSQTARAVEYFQQALKIYQALDDWWGAGNCLLGSGYFHFIDLVKGRRYLLQAIKVFEEGGNTRGLVQALTLLIHAATLQGDVETVEQLFTRYMTLVTNLEQSLFYPETMQANVHHHYVRGQFALAASFLERVISYNRELGRDTGFDNIMLGFCYLHADQFDRGRALLRQTQRELEQLAIDSDWRLALDIHLLAMLAIAEKQFQKATGYLQKARAAFEANDDILGIAGAETFTAVALVGLGDNKSGRPLLASSLKVALDQRAINNLTEVLSGIALLLAHQGELTRAREIYELLWRVPTFRNSTFYQGIAGDEIRELTAALTDEDQQVIKQRVADRDIWQEAAVLLVELQDAGWEDANHQPTED